MTLLENVTNWVPITLKNVSRNLKKKNLTLLENVNRNKNVFFKDITWKYELETEKKNKLRLIKNRHCK